MVCKRLIVPIAILLCAALTFAGLCACDREQQESRLDKTLSITDATGTEFHFDAPLSHLVSAHNPTSNSIVVIGGGGRYLAGFGNKEKVTQLYRYVVEDWDEVKSIVEKGSSTNLETLVGLDPDLVLIPERHAGKADEYRRVGLEAFVALADDESFEAITDCLNRIGSLVGEDERASRITDEFDALIGKASQACAKADGKPRVVFMGDNLYEVASDSMIQTDIIEAVGAENVASGVYQKGEFASVDAESIVKMNPEVIWIPSYASYRVDDVLNDPKLAEVDAVKSGKVALFPSELEPWDYPTASACLGVCWAAHNLHPNLFTQKDLLAACDEFYSLVYGKSFSADQMGLQ